MKYKHMWGYDSGNHSLVNLLWADKHDENDDTCDHYYLGFSVVNLYPKLNREYG